MEGVPAGRGRQPQPQPAGLPPPQHPVSPQGPARRGGSAASPIAPASHGKERNELFSTARLVAREK